MQTSITKISMRLNNEDAEIKAYASIIINGSVKINGIRIIANRYPKEYISFRSEELTSADKYL